MAKTDAIEIKPKTQTTTCSDCNRCLWVEDGPTCPSCLEARKFTRAIKRAKARSAEVDAANAPKDEKAPEAEDGKS